MAFPVTPVLDDFNRAGPALGASWSVPEDAGGADLPEITGSTQAFKNTGSFADGYYDLETYGPDCECFMDIAALPTGTVWAYARLQSPVGPNTMDGYEIEYSFSATQFILWRGKDAVWTTVASASSTGFAAGGGIGLRVLGTGAVVDVQGWARLTASAEWKLVTRYQDTSADRITAAGYIGFGGGNDASWRVDNFGGGRYVPPRRYLPNGDQAPFLPWQIAGAR